MRIRFKKRALINKHRTPSQTPTGIIEITVPKIQMAFEPNAVPICIVAVASAVLGNTNEFLDT